MRTAYHFRAIILFALLTCFSCVRNINREDMFFVREDLQMQLDSIMQKDYDKDYFFVYLSARQSDTLVAFVSLYYFINPEAYLPLIDRGTRIHLVGSETYKNKQIFVSYVSDRDEDYGHMFCTSFNKDHSQNKVEQLSKGYTEDEEPILLDKVSQTNILIDEHGIKEVVYGSDGILKYPLQNRASDYYYGTDGSDEYLLRLDYDSHSYQLFHNGFVSFGIIEKDGEELSLSETGVLHNSVLLQRPAVSTDLCGDLYCRVNIMSNTAVLDLDHLLQINMESLRGKF